MLHTEPSFAIYNSDEGLPGEIKNEDLVAEEVMKGKQQPVRSATIGDSIEAMGSGEFSFGKRVMGSVDENDGEEEKDEALNGFKDSGLGIDGDGADDGSINFTQASFAGDGDGDIEKYYKMMLEENPSNPLFLRKYAQLLQSKGDLSGAEEHHFLATLGDPKDGDILMQYAELVWELYHDKDRAYSYFKRAALAAPEDSHVLGAYARFLWEINDEDDQSKEDLEGDEEHHSGAILADPSDGETISQYAKFIWQLHHDKDKASSYFERAIQASPDDSNVHVAYASFLWETEEDEDEDAGAASEYHSGMPLIQGDVAAAS